MKTNMTILRELLACILIIVVCANANAHDVEIDGIYYNIVDGRAEVTYEGDNIPTNGQGSYSGAVVIPAAIKAYGVMFNVRRIAEYAFWQCPNLTSVTIAEGVEMIRDFAFGWCTNLKSISLPESIWSIGNHAFYYCESITSFVVPPKETRLRNSVFKECKSLTAVTMHSNVTEIQNNVFEGCRNLTSIDIPEGVTRIGILAFQNCTGLESITLPLGLTTIESGAFFGCTGLVSIDIPSNVTSIESFAFCQCTGLTSIDIPSNVTSIKSDAFRGCTGLVSTIIPSSISHFGDTPFADCTGELVLNCDFLYEEAFGRALMNSKFTSIKINGRKYYGRPFQGITTLVSVELGSKVSLIGSYSFANCTEIKTVYVMSSTPLYLDGPLFSASVYKTAILYVPFGSKEAYETAEEWNQFEKIMEMQPGDTPADKYNLLVTDGKVWKLGWFDEESDTADQLEYHYLDGDTLVGEHLCLKLMCKKQDKGKSETSYMAAVYEKGRKVYAALSGTTDFLLIYDFATEELGGAELFNIATNSTELIRIVRKDSQVTDRYKGFNTHIASSTDEADWMESVGCQGFYSLPISVTNGKSLRLMECTVGDEVLYYDEGLKDGVTPLDEQEARKNRLDFTHIIKSQPKGPQVSTIGKEEEIAGAYSENSLFVNFLPLAGLYTVTLSDAGGEVVYRKQVKTDNVLALCTDLAQYPEGTYQLSIENSVEAYTATVSLKGGTGIEAVPSPLPTTQRGAFIYDLQGRRLSNRPEKGLYIEDGRVKVK